MYLENNTFKILCSLPWIQRPAPEDGKPPLPPKSFTTPTRATGLTGPRRLLPAPWCPLYISSVQSLSSVHFSHSVVSKSLRPHESQHPGLPVNHQLPEFTQTHVHWVSDAIQPSHPLLSPSPLALNPSQHQTLFQWVNSLHEVAKVLEFQLQHHSLQRNPKAHLLQNGLVGSPCSPRDSQESSPTPQFKSINS